MPRSGLASNAQSAERLRSIQQKHAQHDGKALAEDPAERFSGVETPVASQSGTRLSWYVRLQHVAHALLGDKYCEEDLHGWWTEARKTLPPPEVYGRLVDRCYAERVVALPPEEWPSADSVVWTRRARTPETGEHTSLWLPRWILADAAHGSAVTREPEREKPNATLWMGDLPGSLCDNRRIKEFIHNLRPASMPTPHVKKVVKQGYRAGTPFVKKNDAEAAAAAAEGVREPASPEDALQAAREAAIGPRNSAGEWLGYAFVEFRDHDEAAEALKLFDGAPVGEGKTIRIQWADERHQGRAMLGRRLGERLGPGCHPPLGEQLFPPCFQGRELAVALENHRLAAGLPLPAGGDAWVLAEIVKARFRSEPRREIHAAGVPVPESLLGPLREELQRTRWPPTPHRSGMQAEEYLVLFRGKTNDGFEDLLVLLDQLLAWADPSFGCNRIAVTKDFQGSPHVDTSDVTYQYAISLGGFQTGGELCVQSKNPNEVNVLNTHDRMARVDGRFVHWVRGHGGGERYSLIFFSTTPDCATEPKKAFHEDFVPAGVVSSA